MTNIANLFVGLVGLLHVGFLVYEMFFWDKSFEPWQLEVEHEKCATASKSLAANQGLYNGFLAAGLYGAASTRKIKILFIQATPAAIALALVYLS